MKSNLFSRPRFFKDELICSAQGFRSGVVYREVSVYRVLCNDEILKYSVRLYTDGELCLTREYSNLSAAREDFYECVKFL